MTKRELRKHKVNVQAASTPIGLAPLSRPQRLAIFLAICIFIATSAWIAVAEPYTAGSDLGYNLGLAGGCMMLSLLLYPLRKRWVAMESTGSMRSWFAYHIVIGIAGPVLVLFHSTYRLSSINGTIAFWSMVIVTLSGVIGRFIYLHVHVELDGHHSTMKDLERYLERRADNAEHILDTLPDVRDQLHDYAKTALNNEGSTLTRYWRFLSASWKKEILIEKTLHIVHKALKARARQEEWPLSRLLAERKALDTLIVDFVRAIDDTARFAVWEQMLGWWHLLHLPVILVLVISGITHVVAVHMY